MTPQSVRPSVWVATSSQQMTQHPIPPPADQYDCLGGGTNRPVFRNYHPGGRCDSAGPRPSCYCLDGLSLRLLALPAGRSLTLRGPSTSPAPGPDRPAHLSSLPEQQVFSVTECLAPYISPPPQRHTTGVPVFHKPLTPFVSIGRRVSIRPWFIHSGTFSHQLSTLESDGSQEPFLT